MNHKLLTMLLLAAGSVFGQVSVGVFIGAPPPPRVVHVRPVCPGPQFIWVEGYWYPKGRHYRWHDGYWTRAPYAEAVWVAPRWADNRYYHGYWDGRRGRKDHDHHWDRKRERDYRDWDRDWDRDRGRGRYDRDHDRH